MNPLKEKYLNEVVPAMQKTLNLENPMQYPKIEKIVVNIGLGEALDNPKALDAAVNDLTQITGQKLIQAGLHLIGWSRLVLLLQVIARQHQPRRHPRLRQRPRPRICLLSRHTVVYA